MSILTQEQLLLNAQKQFDTLKESILDHSQQQRRIDQVERSLFAELLTLGLTLLKAFVAGAGLGDEGKQVSPSDHTLHRSDQPRQRLYRSIFGTLSILRWVYARGAKKKIEHAPTDAVLGLPRGEYSYVMEDWQQRLCVKETFGEGVEGLAALLGFGPSVETAEEMNLRMAEHAESFRIQQPAPPATAQATILVATADGTSVPMHRVDRTTKCGSASGIAPGLDAAGLCGCGVFDRTIRPPATAACWTSCCASRRRRVALVRKANGYGQRWRQRAREV